MMASSAVVSGQNFHVRSISLPSTSHPIMFKVEEELLKLKACTASSSSMTVEKFCNDLKGLGDLYSYISEFLHLQSTLQALSHPIEKQWLEYELERSVRLLEVCGSIKDMSVAIDNQVQELQSALRRKGDSVSEDLIRSQIFYKEARKNMKNCQNLLKQVKHASGSYPSIGRTCDLSMVSRVLIEAREVTVFLLRSALSLLSLPGQKTKASRWSLVSKAMNVRRIGCDGESSRVVGSICFNDVEAGLECLFRQLIQNRVSLLNMLSL